MRVLKALQRWHWKSLFINQKSISGAIWQEIRKEMLSSFKCPVPCIILVLGALSYDLFLFVIPNKVGLSGTNHRMFLIL